VPEIFIGTDIVSVPRLKRSITSSSGEKFINRIYTTNEIEYCHSKKNPIIHFAGRFAAKDAITKAFLSCDRILSLRMNSIEILSDKNHVPEVNLNMDFGFKYTCKVSISHTDENAVAFAILEIFS